MLCIFCKQDSTTSRAVEHIVPESLGNSQHTLPVGAVCDGCNHYFGRKVERPLQEAPVFRQMRKWMRIANKRGRMPHWDAAEGLDKPTYREMGRFLAKVGLEVLAFKTLSVPTWNEEIVTQTELDALRGFARRNEGPDWPYTVRTLYPVNAVFADADDKCEMLHEFDLLVTPRMEYYLVLALLGVEFVLNLGDRELEGYRAWLETHEFASPLYTRRSGQRAR